MSRKRLQIEDLQVTESSSLGISCLALTLQTDVSHAQWLVKQMKKCVDLFDLDLKVQTNPKWKELYVRACGFVL